MKILTLTLFLFMTLCVYSQEPSGCSTFGWNWPSNVTTGSSGTTFTTFAEPGYIYKWVVTGGFEIMGLSTSNNVTIKGAFSNQTGTIYFTKYKNGVMACSNKKNISTISSSCAVPCSSFNVNILSHSCSQTGSNWPLIDVNATAQNPFQNPAIVELIPDPTYYSPSDVIMVVTVPNVGGCGLGGGNAQFRINQNYSGIDTYLHLILRFTDTVTNEVCTKNFKIPISGCSGGIPKNINSKNSFIYPNPVKNGNELNFKNINPVEINNIKVFDLQGNKINNVDFNNNKLTINSNQKGIHFIYLYTSEGLITEKIIIN